MNDKKENGIELLDLFKLIKSHIKIIYKYVVIALLLGIFIIIFTPKQYQTTTSLLAEINSKGSAGGLLGSLGNLSNIDMGSLIGLDLGGSMNSDILTPDLYPEIVNSTTFLVEILSSNIYYKKIDKTITVAKYLGSYTKPSISGIPFYIIGLLKSKSELSFDNITDQKPLVLSKGQSDIIESLANLIDIKIIESGGGLTGSENKIINVSVEAQDPMISAILTELVVKKLKQYIIDYNTNKIKKDLDFIEARYFEAKEKYNKTQLALAEYDDSHVNVILASVQTKRKKLETENNLAASIYKTLAQTLEQTKIQVQDKTPVFSVIEPAKVPIKKSKPKRLLILISMLFVGGFVGTTVILSKELFKKD